MLNQEEIKGLKHRSFKAIGLNATTSTGPRSGRRSAGPEGGVGRTHGRMMEKRKETTGLEQTRAAGRCEILIYSFMLVFPIRLHSEF